MCVGGGCLWKPKTSDSLGDEGVDCQPLNDSDWHGCWKLNLNSGSLQEQFTFLNHWTIPLVPGLAPSQKLLKSFSFPEGMGALMEPRGMNFLIFTVSFSTIDLVGGFFFFWSECGLGSWWGSSTCFSWSTPSCLPPWERSPGIWPLSGLFFLVTLPFWNEAALTRNSLHFPSCLYLLTVLHRLKLYLEFLCWPLHQWESPQCVACHRPLNSQESCKCSSSIH